MATLADAAHIDLRETSDRTLARAALVIIAIVKNLRSYAELLLELDESEVAEILEDGGIGA